MSIYSIELRKEEFPKGELQSANVLIEFGDYECPYSRLGYRFVQKILKDKPNLKFMFRQFPLKKHPNAHICAEAALCAGNQDKFWEMHDLLFDNNLNLSREKLDAFAEELSLDLRKFTVDLETNRFRNWVQTDYRTGVKHGVNDTPTFFFNGTKFESKLGLNTLKEFVAI